jgi:hypothetical protein
VSKIFLEILQDAVDKFHDKIVPKNRCEKQALLDLFANPVKSVIQS